MANHGMLVCSFFVKKRYDKTETESLNPLNDVFEIKKKDSEETIVFSDIFNLMELFCHNNNDLSDDEKKQKLFSVAENSIKTTDTTTYRTMSFVIQSGNYGVEADMTDRKTHVISHHRSADEAAVMKFRCVVYVPKDIGDTIVNKGILVFETIGIYGAKMVTTQYMHHFFAELGLTFATRSVSVRVFLEKLVEHGNLHRITLIKNEVSPNEADNMLISTGKEEKSYLHPKLNPKFFAKILSWFDRADQTGICEIPDNEGFDDIAVTFKINKHPRTVRLKNIERMSIVEDIPDELFHTRNQENRLVTYMIETADDYKKKMVFTIENGV